MLCYEHNSTRRELPFNFNPLRVNAVKKYLEHYSNSLYLAFMLENGTMRERSEASKELTICERKMLYWERQPHFIRDEANRGIEKLKRQWK